MKKAHWLSFVIVSGVLFQSSAQQLLSDGSGPDWRTRPALVLVSNTSNAVVLETNAIVEIGAGMNRWDQSSGQWVKCNPVLLTSSNGIVGQGARHLARFPANLNTFGGIQVQLPGSDSWLKMHLLGLFYEDPATHTNVLIANVQDCAGQVIGDHVYYFDAVAGLQADVRYSYTQSGLSQDILFRSRLPSPAAFGLSADSVRLLAITEIVEGPEPQITDRTWQSAKTIEDDQELDFSGGMRMVPSWAFRLGSEASQQPGIPVVKQYSVIAGRRVLIERLQLSLLQEEFLNLPLAGNTNRTAGIQKITLQLAQGVLPPPPPTNGQSAVRVVQSGVASSKAVVLNWNLVNITTNDFTFAPSSVATYVIKSSTWFTGTTRFASGAVVRFGSSSLFLEGPFEVSNSTVPGVTNRPILTSIDDDTINPAAWTGEALGQPQFPPALVVRAQDYSKAVGTIASRHPGARILPDRPTLFPKIKVEAIHSQADKNTGEAAVFVITRSGCALTSDLTVHFTLGGTSRPGIDFQEIGSSVVIPANEASTEVVIHPISQANDIRRSSVALTLDPDPNAAYIAEGPITGSVVVFDSGASCPPAVTAPSGLIGWWKAENNANDSSGYNNNGVLYNNVTYTAGEVNQAFSFDGISSYVQVNDGTALQVTGSLTIEFWMHRLRLDGHYEYLVEKGGDWTGGQQDYALQIHGPDNGLCLTWNGGYRIAGVINDYNWHHCAVVAVNGQADPIFYIDGVQQSISQSSGGTINMSATTRPLHIGAQIDPIWCYYGNTVIDEMSIYNRALSSTEIGSIFTAGCGGKTLAIAGCDSQTWGPCAWWPAEGNATDIASGNNGTYAGTYVQGEVGNAFQILDASGFVQVPASRYTDIGSFSVLTMECWIDPYDYNSRPIMEWNPNDGTWGSHLWANFPSGGYVWVNLLDTSGVSHCFASVPGLIALNTFQHLAVTYDKSSGNCQIFINGTLKQTVNLGIFTPRTSPNFYIGYRPPNAPSMGGTSFYGLIDEPSLYNRVLSATEIQAIYSAASAGKCATIDANGDGLPDWWQETYFGSTSSQNAAPTADPDGDGLPNLAEFGLETNPNASDNPLNLDCVTDGSQFSGFVQLPINLSPGVNNPPISLFINCTPAANSYLDQSGLQSFLDWNTVFIPNGTYTLCLKYQHNPNACSGETGSIFGQTKTITVNNLINFRQLTSRFTDELYINAYLAVPDASYGIQLYDDNGNPLVHSTGSTTRGEIQLVWDLTDPNTGQQISFGNILAQFNVTPTGGDPVSVFQWFLKEPKTQPGNQFVVAWGWNEYATSFSENNEQMMLNGVINILGNPANPNSYFLAPPGNVPFATAFRYDTDADKQALLTALQQNALFFWCGHGSDTTFGGNLPKSFIGTADIEPLLGNTSYKSRPTHPRQDLHPYKLVILNGCETYSALWAGVFGIQFSATTSTEMTLDYLNTDRTPRAFVGWTTTVDMPEMVRILPHLGCDWPTAHLRYGNALGQLFTSWMSGYPLDVCVDNFATTAASYSFRGQDSWCISGCYDLTRWY